MADFFDLLDDPAPPDPPRREVIRAPAQIPVHNPAPTAASRAYAPKPRTYQNHPCEHGPCTRWGAYGLYDGNISASRWWCAEHAPRETFPMLPPK